MPQVEGGGGSTGSDQIVIPADVMAELRANGYDGPGVVSKDRLAALLSQYGMSGGDGTSSPGATGSSSSSSFGSSGGSGGGGGMSASDRANIRASYAEILRRWGIALDKNMEALINQAINQKWSSTNFIQHLRKTKAYKDAFPGIQWQDGMTEAEYLSTFRQFDGVAKDIGRPLERAEFGVLLKKGVDLTEWKSRVVAQDRIDKNKVLFKNFEAELKRRGILNPKERMTRKDLTDFVRGKGSKAWESVWQTAALESGLQSIGIRIAGGADKAKAAFSDLSRKEFLKFIQRVESGGFEVEDLTGQNYAELAAQVDRVMPASRLANFGLSKTDIIEMQLGSPRAGAIARTVRQALAVQEGFRQGEATNITTAQQAQSALQKRPQVA